MRSILSISARGVLRLGRRSGVVRLSVLLHCVHVFSRLSNRLGCTARGEILLRITLVGLYAPTVRANRSTLLSEVHTMRSGMRGKLTTTTSVPRQIICIGKSSTSLSKSNITKDEGTGPRLPGTVPRSIRRIIGGFHSVTSRTSNVVENFLGGTELDLNNSGHLLVMLPSTVSTSVINERSRIRRLRRLVRRGVKGGIRISIHRMRRNERFRSAFISVRRGVGVRVAIRS